jgi:hypothetical protein
MKSRAEYLRRRRELLISQAAAQRGEVSCISSELQHDLRFVDMGFSIVQAVRAYPGLIAASATLLMPAPRNKILRWSGRLFAVWELGALVLMQWRGYR